MCLRPLTLQQTALRTLFLIVVLHSRHVSAARNQFKHWYPEFRLPLERIMQDNCTAPYNHYLTGSMNHSTISWFTGGDPTNQLAQPVVNCILNSTSEFIKSNMAAAQVLMGLMPTILAVLGPSTDEIATLSVIGKRPLLALCLAAGSPATAVLRSFEVSDPLAIVKDRNDRLSPPQPAGKTALFVLIFEYVVAVAAIVNVATVGRELGVQVTTIFAPHTTYLFLLWSYLVVVIHISGTITLGLRIRIENSGHSNLSDRLAKEFTPMHHRGCLDRWESIKETYWFTFFSWFTALLSVCYVIYGTLTLSSVTFISVRDSLTVIARYVASVVCCRAVLMYELASLRDSYLNPNLDDSDSTSSHELLHTAPNSNVSDSHARTWCSSAQSSAIRVLAAQRSLH